MQAALFFAPSSLPLVKPNKNLASPPWTSFPRLQASSRCHPIKATASDTTSVDYSSKTSVFPAEACETVGGEACEVEMQPEVKLTKEATGTTPKAASEAVDRDYIEYNDPKTVFPAEACDDLGGEFCQPEYQKGVY